MVNLNTNISLEELLKKKGIGPEGSKSLKKDELDLLNVHFTNPSVSLTTKATMLTALLLLDPNEDESIWINQMKSNPEAVLPEQLLPFTDNSTTGEMIGMIRKLIKKNELSEQECISCMQALFSKEVPDYLKGPFLEGERLKRETFQENKTFFNFLWDKASRIQTDLPILIDICDSYDGCTRSPNYSVFVAALLAAAGYPTYLHAIDRVAPKEGLTSHEVLKAAGKNPLAEAELIVKDLKNTGIGWGYIDQSTFFPALFNLKKMRKEMVKRPFLATFEKLLQPIRALHGNHLYTGYTHPHYRTELIKQLAAQNKCSKALVVKGAEGSTQLSMNKMTTGVYYNGREIADISLQPEHFGFKITEKTGKFTNAAETAEKGIGALQGERGDAFENILYTAAVILDSFGFKDRLLSKEYLENLVDTGKALEHWKAGCN